MLVEWTNLRVDRACLDPRPPQMTPPDVYPEGIPFFDARPPQDLPDRLEDDTYLHPVAGGITAPYGGTPNMPNGQVLPEGGLSPLNIIQSGPDNWAVDDTFLKPILDSSKADITGTLEEPVPYPPTVLEDDITIKTGPVWSST